MSPPSGFCNLTFSILESLHPYGVFSATALCQLFTAHFPFTTHHQLPTVHYPLFVTPLLPSSAILCQMEAITPPLISSFIIRFVMEETPAYHGIIRHIQSAEEINFNEWKEAFEFMCRFVPLDELQPPSPNP